MSDNEEDDPNQLHLGTITISQYLNAETGERYYGVLFSGDLPLTDWLGMLALAQHECLAEKVEDE